MNYSHLGLLILVVTTSTLSACSRQTAEEKGKAMAEEKIGLVKGVGEALKESGKQATESLTHGVGSATQGIGAGMEASAALAFKPHPSLTQHGMKISRVQSHSHANTEGHVVSAYLITDKAVSGRMTFYAFDKQNVELGRVTRDIKLAANGAGFEDFSFDARTPIKTASYLSAEFTPAAAR